jgi:hypothetical protein
MSEAPLLPKHTIGHHLPCSSLKQKNRLKEKAFGVERIFVSLGFWIL